MPYTRTYKARLLVEPDTDLEQMRWLQRESFQRRAAADMLRIVDYTETEIPTDELNPAVAKDLPRPLEDYQCFEFIGVAEVDRDAVAALTAEAPADA
ncbi:hypothetical protein FK529_05440 [Tsukamurella asaccharolytica]|uniref:Minor tail protein n=1 Tax=Tsukamurella asaccharolytica TaxID=2592067 RepID=A0A5C5RF86_9ACTN|nr:hypothetical protein [Tsukamurella asaccharolytica]TWS20771.1 hypothetical protein FK529_05440 [Tsukamurella asaccharolytica]